MYAFTYSYNLIRLATYLNYINLNVSIALKSRSCRNRIYLFFEYQLFSIKQAFHLWTKFSDKLFVSALDSIKVSLLEKRQFVRMRVHRFDHELVLQLSAQRYAKCQQIASKQSLHVLNLPSVE